MESRFPSVYLDYIGRQFRLWRQYGIADSFRTKLMDLWIGYGYTQYMDSQGRYTFHSFNLLRKELGFRSVLQMIDYVKKSRSFVLLSCDVDTTLLCDRKFFQTSRPEKEFADHLTMFYSPAFHQWRKEDGQPLDGSIGTSCSSDCSSNRYNNNTLDNKDLTGSTAGAVEAVGPASAEGLTMSISDIEAQQQHELQQAIAHAKAYFRGLILNEQAAQREPMDMLLWRFQQPLTPEKGQVKGYGLTEAQAHELLQLMIDRELAPHFARDRQFMSPTRIKDPGQRIYQVKGYIKRYSTDMATRSYKHWLKLQAERERLIAQQTAEAIRQNRPISPYEWQEPQGNRYYHDPADGVVLIPADAPPRPSENAYWNKFANQWQL